MRWAGAASMVVLAGCGAGGADGTREPDADVEARCEMTIVSFDPAEPERGDTVVVTAEIGSNGIDGFRRYEWSASTGGQRVDVISRGDDAIEFQPLRAGIYDVSLQGSVGETSCWPDTRTLNVREIGAEVVDYRLRVVPSDGRTPVELEVEIPGGADYDLGQVGIDTSAQLSGQLIGPEGPLSGYLRIRAAGGGEVEAFADDDGAFRAPKPPGEDPYALLVVPNDAAVAPALVEDLDEDDLAEIRLEAGIEIGGAVLDADGEPVEGARVSLSVGGVPSTVGETDADGVFSLRARPGEATLRVSAKPDSGLLDLRATGVEVEAGADLVISYASAPAPVAVSPEVRDPAGDTPAPRARVTWISEIVDGAGTVDTGDGPREASGSARRAATADDSGALPELFLPHGVYEVVVAPGEAGESGVAARVRAVNLDDEPPATLTLAVPAELRGVVRGGEDGLAGVKLVASPEGALVRAAGANASVTSGEGGAFSLPLAGGVGYELALIPPPGAAFARAQAAAEPAAAGETTELEDLVLPAAIIVRGELSSLGGGALSGAHVSLRCVDCEVDRGATPIAEALTDAAGRFRLAVPDPGVADE